jgi:hypothetical protein
MYLERWKSGEGGAELLCAVLDMIIALAAPAGKKINRTEQSAPTAEQGRTGHFPLVIFFLPLFRSASF